MSITLNRLTKGQPDWHIPLNENAQTIEEAFGGTGMIIPHHEHDAVDVVTGVFSPELLPAASTANSGIVQLNNTVTEADATQALSVAGGNSIYTAMTTQFAGYHKLLWNGSWTTGAIVVPSISKYGSIILSAQAHGTLIQAYIYGVQVRGVGGYSTTVPTALTYQFTGTFDAVTDTLTMVIANNTTHTAPGSHSNSSQLTITNIWGEVPRTMLSPL
jgi:hypothetical protein